MSIAVSSIILSRKRGSITIQKLEKKLLEVGYENLDDYSLDKIHADKWLGQVRIREIARQRKKGLDKVEPVQMSLFDMEGFNDDTDR